MGAAARSFEAPGSDFQFAAERRVYASTSASLKGAVLRLLSGDIPL